MIVKAKVVWNVSVTIDIPADETSVSHIREKIFDQAAKEITFVEPTITGCIERPEVND